MKSFRSQISSEVANRFRTAVDRGMPDLGKAERGVERVRPKIGRVRINFTDDDIMSVAHRYVE